MFDQIRIDALSSSCTSCSKQLADRDRIVSAYLVKDITTFERQVELGILGAQVRNFWVHVNCQDPFLSKGYHLQPSIQHCIKCSNQLTSADVVSPVFQVVAVQVQNPTDATDIGIGLGERVYFIHVDCSNHNLQKTESLLYLP